LIYSSFTVNQINEIAKILDIEYEWLYLDIFYKFIKTNILKTLPTPKSLSKNPNFKFSAKLLAECIDLLSYWPGVCWETWSTRVIPYTLVHQLVT